MLWRMRPPRVAKLALVVGIAAGLALVWLVPTVIAVGGWESFRDLMRRHVAHNAPMTCASGGRPSLRDDVLAAGAYCWLVYRRRHRRCWWDRCATHPGYMLSCLPGLFLLAAAGASRMAVSWVIGVAVVNVAVCWTRPGGCGRCDFEYPAWREDCGVTIIADDANFKPV